MRKRIAVGVGLVAAVLALTVLVCDRMEPAEPPLCVGMSRHEVANLLGPTNPLEIEDSLDVFDPLEYRHYCTTPDWLGNRQLVVVAYDENGSVVNWKKEALQRTCPPWLDRAMKAVGW
jgi:hypothetical protein